MTAGPGRYALAGRCYDLVSLEPLLYRRPRRRLIELLALHPGATVVDLGCGTGLNFAPVLTAVGPAGRVIGIDTSASMLGRARRRTRKANWTNVTLLHGDIGDLVDLLAATGLGPDDVDAVLATFVLSVIPTDQLVWDALDVLAATRAVRIGIADLAEPDTAPIGLRPLYWLLTVLGGADAHRQPWTRLTEQPGSMQETHLGGYVHLAANNYGPHAPPR